MKQLYKVSKYDYSVLVDLSIYDNKEQAERDILAKGYEYNKEYDCYTKAHNTYTIKQVKRNEL